MVDKEKFLHDISIAYLLYRNVVPNSDLLTLEEFYQEYENLTHDFKPIIDHYNR